MKSKGLRKLIAYSCGIPVQQNHAVGPINIIEFNKRLTTRTCDNKSVFEVRVGSAHSEYINKDFDFSPAFQYSILFSWLFSQFHID
jgi:hypothetical protein